MKKDYKRPKKYRPKTIAFQQREGFCGAASLRIILHFLGIKMTEMQIIKMMGAISRGIEGEHMVKLAEKLKLKAFIKDNAEISDLREYVKKKKTPVIVEWFLEDDGHFSVVDNIGKENIHLQDPDLGHIRAMRLDIFKRLWFSFPGKYIKDKSDLTLRRMIVITK